MKYIRGELRNAFRMTCLDDQIDENDMVRAIDAIVDSLNPTRLGYKEKLTKSNAGRLGFDVFTMTKLYILGYRLGIRSGRKLEATCKYDIRFQWLLENKTPDANVINDFRKDNLTYLKNMFYEENEISDEERESTKSKDIRKCLRSGVIPKCYEEYIDNVEVVESEVSVKENITPEKETRGSEEIRETAIAKQTFERDTNLNVVYCPAGELLAQKSKKSCGKVRYANKLACKNCKNPCTLAKFKEVDFGEGQKTLAPRGNVATKPRNKTQTTKKVKKVVKIKLRLNAELLKRRMQTSEHSQGTMKTVDNHRCFNMRGIRKAGTELAIYFTASNMRRVCNMVGVPELLSRIKSTFQNSQKDAILGL